MSKSVGKLYNALMYMNSIMTRIQWNSIYTIIVTFVFHNLYRRVARKNNVNGKTKIWNLSLTFFLSIKNLTCTWHRIFLKASDYKIRFINSNKHGFCCWFCICSLIYTISFFFLAHYYDKQSPQFSLKALVTISWRWREEINGSRGFSLTLAIHRKLKIQ